MDTDFSSQNASLQESVIGYLFKEKSLAKKCVYLSIAQNFFFFFENQDIRKTTEIQKEHRHT